MTKTIILYLLAIIIACVLQGILIGAMQTTTPDLYQHTFDAQNMS